VYLGDVDRVRQVLVNVLGNAVSFTPVGGRVAVVAARVCEAPAASGLVGGPWCSIRVEDTGPGIPCDKIEHVFEPFVQLSSDGQATRKGTGLGLTVSRQLALLMGGDLTVESAGVGVGATFTLWLPESIANGTRGLAPGRRAGELTPSGQAGVVGAPAPPAAH
jgi:signal transduction histidine kinase